MNYQLSMYFWIAHAISTFGSMIFLNKSFTLLFQNPLLSGGIQFVLVTVPILLNLPQFKVLSRYDLRRLIIGTDLIGFVLMLVASTIQFSTTLVLIIIFISTLIDSLQLSKKMSSLTFSREAEEKAQFAGYFFVSHGIVLILSPILLISFQEFGFRDIILFNGFTYIISAIVGYKIQALNLSPLTENKNLLNEFKILPIAKNFSFVFAAAVSLGSMSVILPLIYIQQSEVTVLIRILCLSVGTIIGGLAAAKIWSVLHFRLACVSVACTGICLLLALVFESTVMSHFFAVIYGVSMPSLEILLNQLLAKFLPADATESDFHQGILQIGTFTKIFFGIGVLTITTCIYFIGILNSAWISVGLAIGASVAVYILKRSLSFV